MLLSEYFKGYKQVLGIDHYRVLFPKIEVLSFIMETYPHYSNLYKNGDMLCAQD